MVGPLDSGSSSPAGFDPWPETLCCVLGQDTFKCTFLHTQYITVHLHHSASTSQYTYITVHLHHSTSTSQHISVPRCINGYQQI